MKARCQRYAKCHRLARFLYRLGGGKVVNVCSYRCFKLLTKT